MPIIQWIGKEKVVGHHHDVPLRALRHKYGFRSDDPEDLSPTRSGNKIIHGDNLEALKALLPSYEGKVDCVYIDPPYNTGNEGWVYNDNVGDPQMLRWLGQVVGPEGEDLSRHDKWLCMMYPRLQLLRRMLSEEGVVFVSLDNNEVASLRFVMDEIFGPACFVNDIIWQKAYSARNDSKGIPSVVDHTLVYSKRPGWQPRKLERTEEMDSKYKNPDNDFALWTSSDAFASEAATHQGMVYAIQHPFTGELVYPYANGHWRYGQEEMLAHMNGWCDYELRDLDDAKRRAAVCGIRAEEVRPGIKGIVLRGSLEESREAARRVYDRGQWPRFYFTNGGKGGIRRKTYLTNVEGRLITNLWTHDEVGHTDEAKKELKTIFDGKSPFDTPKPVRLVERVLQVATSGDSIVLDAFAGSATTAHAVLRQNARDKGSRKFVLVEMNEYSETLTAERVRRVMGGHAFKGKEEVELYSRRLTPKNILDAAKLLGEAEKVAQANKESFTKVGKPKIEGDCLKVIGTKVYDGRVEGLGGAFDFYELGEPLFLEDGSLNEAAGEETMRSYIFYSETRGPLTHPRDPRFKHLLDYSGGVGYFFYYEPDKLTTLGVGTLGIIGPQRAERYVVYADTCNISEVELERMGITFKKIPRDIQRF